MPAVASHLVGSRPASALPHSGRSTKPNLSGPEFILFPLFLFTNNAIITHSRNAFSISRPPVFCHGSRRKQALGWCPGHFEVFGQNGEETNISAHSWVRHFSMPMAVGSAAMIGRTLQYVYLRSACDVVWSSYTFRFGWVTIR